MKKIYLFLFAVVSILTVASCQRDELAEPAAVRSGETTKLTIGFDATKTALVDGKTKWLAGDKVRVFNSTGNYFEDVVIPEDQADRNIVEVEVSMKDTKYFAVYPVESASGVASGKLNVSIPSNPDGLFESANICAGESAENGTDLTLKNVAAIVKVNISSGNVVEILQFNAQNSMTGTYSVDFSEGAPALTAVSASKSATVAVGGVDGDYYVAVAPGTYKEEFSITALRGNGGYQTLTSSRENEILRNQIVSLGSIGDNLSDGLKGEGTESDPYLISNLGEFGAFSASVNLGNPYTGKFVSLVTDITEPVASPIGYYISADVQFPFAGTFLGNDHSIVVDLEGENCKSQNYVALFGVVDAGGTVKDLKVSGKVNSTGNYASGIIGYVRGSADSRVSLENLSSSVEVTSTGSRIAGIAGYASYADIKGCSNNGEVFGTNSVGGIAGYIYFANIENCVNNVSVSSEHETANPTGVLIPYYQYYTIDNLNNSASGTWNNGTGGIAGYAQNSTITDSNNVADITGYIKVGGIVGTSYWITIRNVNNSGAVTAAGNLNIRADSQYGCQWGSLVGGIAGWVHVQGVVENSNNTGKVNGLGGVGGIVSLASCGNNAISAIRIADCVNTGEVVATSSYSGGTSSCANVGAGGICAATSSFTVFGTATTNQYVTIENCVNKADVTATNASNSADAVGGIVGNCYDPNRQSGTTVSISGGTRIIGCVNEGNITGDYYTGGLVGLFGARYGQNPIVRNSANHGKVASHNYSAKYNGVLIGGLAGGVMAYNTTFRARTLFTIYNSYNDGDVLYDLEDYATPYIGGIIGSTWGGGVIGNTYNAGNVGLSNGKTPSAGALKCLGALVGYQNADVISNSYYAASSLNAIGENSAVKTNDSLASFNDKFEFAGVVTYNDKDYETLLDILNAWVGNSASYYKWKAGSNGPEFDI
ncbi:MAG: hypothetical protein IJ222_00470 [Bacteroidales bacterium]|nr:hypothetical protein [Bacteroidales bacterium]